MNELTPRQMQVWELEAEGLNGRQIAEKLGVSRAAISQIRGHENYRANLPPLDAQKSFRKRKVHEMAKVVRQEILKEFDPVIKLYKENALEMSRELVRLATQAESEEVRRGAINDSLGYAGYAPEKKTISQTVQLSSEDAEKISYAMTYTQTRTRGSDPTDQN